MGCGRNLDEIRVWSESADEERVRILERAARRRAEREARMQAWRQGQGPA